MTTTTQFDSTTSQLVCLASDAPAKIVAIIAKVTGVELDPKLSRKQLTKAARELGWRWNGDVVPSTYKAKYGKAQTCGDEVAEALARFVRSVNPETSTEYFDIKKAHEIAKSNGFSLDRWLHCNIGQIRMNMSNVMRGMVRRGEQVTIGDETWNKGSEVKAKKPAKAKAKRKAKAKPEQQAA